MRIPPFHYLCLRVLIGGRKEVAVEKKKKPWEIENINKFSLAMCKDLEWVKWGPTVQQKCLHKKGCETWHFQDEGECKTWDKLGASASEDKFTVASYCVTPQEISH